MHENSCEKDSVVTPVLPTRKLSLGDTKAANVVGKALREAKKIIDAKCNKKWGNYMNRDSI